jgi:hypothetical protein
MDFVNTLLNKIKTESDNVNIKRYCDAIEIILSVNNPVIPELKDDKELQPEVVETPKTLGRWLRHLNAYMQEHPGVSRSDASIAAKLTYVPTIRDNKARKGVPESKRKNAYVPRVHSAWVKHLTAFRKEHPGMPIGEATTAASKTYAAMKAKLDDDKVMAAAAAQPVLYADSFTCLGGQPLPEGVKFVDVPLTSENLKELFGTGAYQPETNM